MTGAEIAAREQLRRFETMLAISEVIEPADPASSFTVDGLRRHLALYYGRELAEAATVADLVGGAARSGACPTAGVLWNARLRKPPREAMRRIATRWNAEIPPAEIPMIRRSRQDPEVGGDDGEKDAFDPGSLPPAGALYRDGGKWRQAPDPSVLHVYRDGGDNRRGSTVRRRRFPSYIAQLRKLLDGKSTISAIDRQILEHVVEGKTLQWIADELGMKKVTVHKRVATVRRKAGINGPGAGR